MEWEAAAVLVAGLWAAVATIVVPALAFNFALRQDQQRFAREERARAYVDAFAHLTAIKAKIDQLANGSGLPQDIPEDDLHIEARMVAYASDTMYMPYELARAEADKARSLNLTTNQTDLLAIVAAMNDEHTRFGGLMHHELGGA